MYVEYFIAHVLREERLKGKV